MEKNMKENFSNLKNRVEDTLKVTDLEYIRYELSNIKTPTMVSGVGGSSVVSDFASKVLSSKNNIISHNFEPRDFLYTNVNLYDNVLVCSYSGNNYGVDLSFNNNLNKYLLSSKTYTDKDKVYLTYNSTLDKEKSFISLAATMMPISVLLDYYLDGKYDILSIIKEHSFSFDTNCDVYEIFSGLDTSTVSKYLESTIVESGIGVPIVHDKYAFCHGRSTLSKNYNNVAIYLNKNTEFDKLAINELYKHYKDVIIIDSEFDEPMLSEYDMLTKAMYLTKYIAEQKEKDLSGVDYSPMTKKFYKYNGNI